MSFDPTDPAFLAAVAQAVAAVMHAQQQTAAISAIPAAPSAPTVPDNSPKATTWCPKVSEITMLQATQYDAGSKQPYKQRFKVCLEVWTEPEEKNIKLSKWQWKRYVLLYSWQDFRNLAYKGLKRGTISKEYYDWIEQVTDQSHQIRHWFGFIGDKSQGTHYYDNQFVRVQMDDNDRIVHMNLILGGEAENMLGVEHWSQKDCKGQRLKGNFTAQARVDRCDYGMGWATEEQ